MIRYYSVKGETVYDNYDELYGEEKEVTIDEGDQLTYDMPAYDSYEYEDEEQIDNVIDEELYKD